MRFSICSSSAVVYVGAAAAFFGTIAAERPIAASDADISAYESFRARRGHSDMMQADGIGYAERLALFNHRRAQVEARNAVKTQQTITLRACSARLVATYNMLVLYYMDSELIDKW
ncbi:unnamed protein product [Polarella glacialis]|uniref:Uncharacterized protein n=1 Tax=Polarella glacialis TaxID=89957 RepID=A0A813KG93_POLGL|nr:unnamed protein product [Polarella glacialis]